VDPSTAAIRSIACGSSAENWSVDAKSVVMLLVGDIDRDGRVQKEVASLRARGHGVTLIQWPHRNVPRNYDSLGLNVIEYLKPLHRNAAVNFVHQLSFNRFALRHLRRLSPDVVQCNDLNTLPAGYAFRHHAHIIYDAHELFPESQFGIRRRVWSWLENWMVHGCNSYIQPEKNRLAYFAKKYDIDPARIALVENFPSERYEFSGRDRLREHFSLDQDAIILLCSGVLGPEHNIENMIDGMALLDSRFVLVLLGPTYKGYERALAGRISSAGVDGRVMLHPAIPNRDMLDFVRSSDIGLVFYKNNSLNTYWCASNKLYEFIFCHKPVITNDYPGLLEVVARNHLGVCLPDTSAPAIAGAVRRISDEARVASTASPYVWERQEQTYLRLFE
jgi:glycosyltransferase involved in cell wall biosynthesis